MQLPLDDLLRRAVEVNASDVHLKVGSPPVVRVDGELRRLANLPALKPVDTESYASDVFTPKAGNDFKERGEADFAYGRPDVGRFRVSAFRQRGSVSVVMRRVVPGAPALDRLGLPPIVHKLTGEERGLVLVTGPAGSGRTTTVAAMVEHINATRPVSVVTVEDPIEVLFPDKLAVVAQREVGVDTASFASGVERATRQDADVIMVTAVWDRETARSVVAAAETGHLVIAAMHTIDPGETVGRLLALFPPDEQGTARVQIANHLRGVVSQRLLDSADGTGRVLACEVLVGNGKVQEQVLAGAPGEKLLETIRESEFFGMQTFDQSLLKLLQSRRITVAAALPHVRNSHEFRANAIAAGIDA